MRSVARETVFQFLFSKLFNKDDEGLFSLLLNNSKLNEEDKKFATELLNAVENKYDEYTDKVNELASKNGFNRVFNADACAILIGMAEFDNFKETPIPVIIDQAVNLASKFSTEKSTDFVNGILAEYIRKK